MAETPIRFAKGSAVWCQTTPVNYHDAVVLKDCVEGDTEAVVRLLSTVLWNLEQQDTPNVMYWLSVLLAYEKRQRAAKQPVTMAARQPLPPTDATRAVAVEGKAAQDWVWVLWLALDTACVHYQRPTACRRALRDLAYLFAHDYKTGRRTTRMPLVLHAMHLVRTDTLDWTRSVYPNDAAKALVVKACTNIEVMYAEVQRRRLAQDQPVQPAPEQRSPDDHSPPQAADL